MNYNVLVYLIRHVIYWVGLVVGLILAYVEARRLEFDVYAFIFYVFVVVVATGLLIVDRKVDDV